MRPLRCAMPVLVLLAALGCGAKGELQPLDRVQFVRGGVVLPEEWAKSGEPAIHCDNDVAMLANPQALAQGCFFPFDWRPGSRCVIDSIGERGGGLRLRDVYAPMRPEPAVVACVPLESVHAGSVTAGEEPDAALAFSEDGSLLALGTFGGYVRVFETSGGKCVFEKRLPGAVVKRVAVSPDNRRVFAGEMSPDGFVRAFDIASGRELWRFRLADDLGMSKPARGDDFYALYSYPQAYCMRAVGADLIVDGFHSWSDAGGAKHLSRLYRLDGKTGAVRWRFPADAPMPRNIAWFDVSGDALAFSAYQWEKPEPSGGVPQSMVGLVRVSDGALLDRRAFEPLAPFFTTTPMWYGLALDGAGHLAAGFVDGRAEIFATGAKLSPVRSLELATPIDVSGVPIYAGANWAGGVDNTLFLLTDGRLIVESAAAKGKSVRADHFNSNTLFAFDGGTGKLLWQWKLTTTAQGVAAGKGVVAVSTQQSYSSDDPMDYGLTVFDPTLPGSPVEKMLFRYNTSGPIVALAVSPDGSRIAAVEAPVRLADGLTVVGKYRLHIIR